MPAAAAAARQARTRQQQHQQAKTITPATGFGSDAITDLFVDNISYGPWQKSDYLNYFQEGALELSIWLTPDSLWLMRFWPGICNDHGWREEAETGRPARAAFIKTLPDVAVIRKKCKKATKGRWFSGHHAHNQHDKHTTTKLMVGAFVAVRCNWVKHMSELRGGKRPVFKSTSAPPPGHPAKTSIRTHTNDPQQH